MEKVIAKIMNKIIDAGFSCYVVGGYVRDYLLGITSYDVDICTNALPKDIHNIFNTNMNDYGCNNFKVGNYNIDITTFREELTYDGHCPVVKYIDDLETDLLRRDFTINAICMDVNGKIIDKLGGIKDLNNRVIKMIGDADKRLKEDPLRILRTIRFYAKLGFTIDDKLMQALKKNAKLVKEISKTRVKMEYSKILLDHNFMKALELGNQMGINKYLDIKYKDIIFVSDLMGMYAQIRIENLPFTKEEKNNIIKITEIIDKGVIDVFVLYYYGLYHSLVAGQILNYGPKTINKLYKSLVIKSRKDIDITSKILIEELKITPNMLSRVYIDLELNILDGKLKNNQKHIIKYLKESEYCA